jgi:hypothetical protein
MGDILAFPTIRNVLWSGKNIHKFTATTAVKAGQVVAFAATGVSGAVIPAVKGTSGQPIGVALYGADAGKMVSVACNGCICKVANSSATTAIDAGDLVYDDDAAPAGTVCAVPVLGGGVAVGVVQYLVGEAIDIIAGDNVGRILVKCGTTTAPMTA